MTRSIPFVPHAPTRPGVRPTATFTGADGRPGPLRHPCGRCGAAVAPIGEGVCLRAAMAGGGQARAGLWYCGPCARELGVL